MHNGYFLKNLIGIDGSPRTDNWVEFHGPIRLMLLRERLCEAMSRRTGPFCCARFTGAITPVLFLDCSVVHLIHPIPPSYLTLSFARFVNSVRCMVICLYYDFLTLPVLFFSFHHVQHYLVSPVTYHYVWNFLVPTSDTVTIIITLPPMKHGTQAKQYTFQASYLHIIWDAPYLVQESQTRPQSCQIPVNSISLSIHG